MVDFVGNEGDEMKALAMALLGLTLGAAAMHYGDAVVVADVLKSDDLSITRNAEQANALLDIYEQGKTKDQIVRNGKGEETDIVPLSHGERVAVWVDEYLTRIEGGAR
jgi:hypothetical protein